MFTIIRVKLNNLLTQIEILIKMFNPKQDQIYN